MADAEHVPPLVEESPQRIQSRDAADFARLPDDETMLDDRATRDAVVADRVVWPPVLIVVGFVLAFSVFIFRVWPVLVVGFLLMLIGSIWSSVSHRGGGTGRSTI